MGIYGLWHITIIKFLSNPDNFLNKFKRLLAVSRAPKNPDFEYVQVILYYWAKIGPNYYPFSVHNKFSQTIGWKEINIRG